MSLSPQSIVLRMLKLSGITSLNPNLEANELLQRGVVSGDVEEARIVLNAAIQEAWAEAPSALNERVVAEVLRPPTQITVAVTQYSKTVTVTGWQSWMQGCTVRLAGDNQDNRLTSQTSLLSPFMGSTSLGVNATVYADALPLPSTYLNIIGPVELPDRRLHMVSDPQAFRDYSRWNQHGHVTYESYGSFQNKSVGTPEVAFVDSDHDGTLTYLPVYLRVNPMPDRAYPISFRAKITPRVYAMEAILNEADYTEEPDEEITQDWAESVLLPIAMQRWQAHPSCVLGPTQRDEIARQYSQAINFLQSLRPKTGSVTATYL